MTIRIAGRAVLPCVLAAAVNAAAAPPPKDQEDLVRPPHIDVPGPWSAAQRPLLVTDPDALPKGAGAHLPAYDGDSFFVTLPVRQRDSVSADEVADEVLVPVLKAIGFQRGLKALRKGPPEGVAQPVADFPTLAEVVEDEYARTPALLRPRTMKMLDVFMGRAPVTPEIDATIETGEGMTFAQLVANIERKAIVYPFLQLQGDVPIEHTLVLASRWEGQGVTTVHGALFERYTVGNAATLTSQQAVTKAIGALDALPEVKVANMEPVESPVLVLLPYQADPATGVVEMRYAFRTLMDVDWTGHRGQFLLWIDAQDGRLLQLNSLIENAVAARGRVWNRDPGVGTATSSRFFKVEPAIGGQYVLKLDALGGRLNYIGAGDYDYTALDVSIPDDSGGSSATLANFDQAPLNDDAGAVCATGANKAFSQVHVMATLSRQYRTVMGQGIFRPFPERPFVLWVDAGICNALSSLEFGDCEGFHARDCPNFSDGTSGTMEARRNWLSFAQDNTVIGHELGHNVTQRLTSHRPDDWCGSAPCSMPVGLGHLHDVADAWAAHFESTNCFGGWVAKNSGGVDASLYCAQSDEGGEIPRLHSVATPFDPRSPGDHFPEHPRPDPLRSQDYSDGQVAAAALWEVRAGMRSKCRPSGLLQYGVRFQRALRETGFLGFTPGWADIGHFQHMYDLELQMVDQWATSGSPSAPPAFAHNGPHTTNKVTAGFARAGVFLTPYQCLDGSTLTRDRSFCPYGEDGSDAVVDVDDNEPADDLRINGVVHPERDYLRAGGPAPTFLVWTGARYRLDGVGGAATFTYPAPCNRKFRVEVSSDPAFPISAILSPWVAVDMDPGTPETPECFGTWTPSAAQWDALQSGGARVYFRARTRDALDGNERLSTRPGGGLWTVPPPYAVITPDGRSDY